MFIALFPEEVDEDLDDPDRSIHCMAVDDDILGKAIEYCTLYQETEMKSIDCKDKEKQHIQADNYINIQPLLSLSVLAMCTRINNKSEDEIWVFLTFKSHEAHVELRLRYNLLASMGMLR